MTTFKISVNAPEHVHGKLLSRAQSAGVPLATYSLAVLSAHAAKAEAVAVEPPKIGLAAVHEDRRREIAKSGGLAVTGWKASKRSKKAQRTRKLNK